MTREQKIEGRHHYSLQESKNCFTLLCKEAKKNLFSGFMDKSKMTWISATKRLRLTDRKNFLEIRKDEKNKTCEEVVLFQLLDFFKNRLDKHVY